MRIIQGDLIALAEAGKFDIIVHGCNCFCKMGSGIAKQIADKWPAARKADASTKIGDHDKLGKYSEVSLTVPLMINNREHQHVLTIINAYTQYNYGNDGALYFDYNALEQVMEKLLLACETHGPLLRIGMPRIGSGLAGGDPAIIEEIIRKYSDFLDITIVDYDKTN